MLQPLSKGPLEHGDILQSIDCLDIADKRHAPEFRISGVPVPKGCLTTKVPDSSSARFPECMIPIVPECRIPIVPECRIPRVPECRIPRVPECLDSGSSF